MAKTARPPTFGEIIDDVQKSPDPFGAAPTTDLANPFNMPLPAGHRIHYTDKEPLGTAGPGVTYAHHSEIFNLCNKDERASYDELQSKLANAKYHYLVTKDRTWTKEGDCLCLVEWVITTPVKKLPAARVSPEDDEDDN